MSPPLRELQEALLALLRQEGPISPEAAAAIAAGGPGLSPREQLEIYRDQFFQRHVECLADDFPTLLALLGSGAFEGLCRAYLAAHPPATFSLRDIGAHLPAYLAAAPGTPAGEGDEAPIPRPWLVDIARMEWALIEAFDAEDAPPLESGALQRLSPEELDGARFSLDPSLRLLALGYPAHEVLAAVEEGGEVTLPEARPSWVVVHRDAGLNLAWSEIPRVAFRALELLREGKALAEAMDAVAEGMGEDELAWLMESVGGWFGEWARRGWIRSVTP